MSKEEGIRTSDFHCFMRHGPQLIKLSLEDFINTISNTLLHTFPYAPKLLFSISVNYLTYTIYYHSSPSKCETSLSLILYSFSTWNSIAEGYSSFK